MMVTSHKLLAFNWFSTEIDLFIRPEIFHIFYGWSYSVLPWENNFDSNKIFCMREGLYEVRYKKQVMEFKGSIFRRNTAKNTAISPNFLVRKFYGKTVSAKSEIMRKLCLSTKLPHQEIRWNYGIFCSGCSICEPMDILGFENSDINRVSN